MKEPKYILCESDKGNEILDFLKSKMEIPEGLQSLTLRFDVRSLLEITCTYYPKPKPEVDDDQKIL